VVSFQVIILISLVGDNDVIPRAQAMFLTRCTARFHASGTALGASSGQTTSVWIVLCGLFFVKGGKLGMDTRQDSQWLRERLRKT
jgi:hypothetical protein